MVWHGTDNTTSTAAAVKAACNRAFQAGLANAESRWDEADIARMVPVVDVRKGCDGDRTVSQRETVDSNGRRAIRIRICEAQIEAQALRSARAGLMKARAKVERATHMSDRIRADVLRDLDEEIAQIDGQRN